MTRRLIIRFDGGVRCLEALRPFGCPIAVSVSQGVVKLLIPHEGTTVEIGDFVTKDDAGRIVKVREDEPA